MDESGLTTKLKHAIHLGCWLGLIGGVIRVVILLLQNNYFTQEIATFGVNYLQVSVNHFLLLGLAFGILLGICWRLFRSLEGFLLAGLLVALPILPVANFLNRNIFPGRFHPISLAGNAAILVIMIALAIWLFLRWFKPVRFLHRLYSKWTFAAAFVLVGCVNLFYLLQMPEARLQAASPEPDGLAGLFRTVSASTSGGVKTGFSMSDIKNHLTKTAEDRLPLLDERIARKDTADIMAEADASIARTFDLLNIAHTFPGEIEWRQNPTKDREWLLALNRMDWIWSVAVAYRMTQDSQYALAFDRIMRSWFEQNPVPRWKNERDNVWRLIESSARMTDSWIEAFFIFYNCDQVSEEVKWRMLASFHDHAQFLAHFRSPRRNHLLQETYGLLAVAAAFPEFKMSETWIEIARLRLDRAMREDVYPDGGYTEGSIYYHRFAIRILQEITDFAAAYDVRLSDFFYQQLEKMYSFLMHTSRPDGVMPQMNDGFHAKNLRIMFDRPAEFFSRQDFEYFASDGYSGVRPESPSVAFPYSGIYVMRSGWARQARYMITDAGPFGSSHGHEDKLSFELFAFGRPFIVESGTYTYVRNKWRKYFTSSFAHNTIVVDGRSQIRFPDQELWVNAPPETLANQWISTDAFDYLEAHYDGGYGSVKEDVLSGIVHTRRWLFVKPDYWIIWDVVEGEGEHKLEQLFHFWHEANVEILGENEIRASYSGGPAMSVHVLGEKQGRLTAVRGQDSPVQGWVSSEYGKKMPASSVRVTRQGVLPISFVTILAPSELGQPDERVESVQVTAGGQSTPQTEAIAVKLTFENQVDHILIAPNLREEKSFGEFATGAELFAVREKGATATQLFSREDVK